MKGKFTLKAAVVIVLVFAFVVVYAIVVRREAGRIADRRVVYLLKAIDLDCSEFREPYTRGPEDFFHASDVLHASEAIMTGDSDKLRQLIGSGLDVNSTGKAGITLLHWALACRSLEAFQLLLDSGADPDKRLKYSLALPQIGKIHIGDSVLFSCLRQAKWPFLFAAIGKTSDVDHLDVNGHTLLIASLRQYGLGAENPALLSIDEEIFQRLIDSGVNLDARCEYGYTAAWHALHSGRPLLCLMILEAGGDPDIPCNDGETLGGALTGIIKHYEDRGLVDRLAEARLLQQWLNVYHKKAVKRP